MRNLTVDPDLANTLAAIDQANALDPNVVGGQPLALVQGQNASRWLDQLNPQASPELQLAVRAHHLNRWQIARSEYPDGRAGYLHWRRDNKAHQAESLAGLMSDDGWAPELIERAKMLLGRTKLRSDPDTQTLEDAACLVFLETQYQPMVDRVDHDHLVDIVRKTLAKMSPSAIDLASSVALSDRANTVLVEASQ